MDTFDTKPGLYHQDGDHGAGAGVGVADDSGVVGGGIGDDSGSRGGDDGGENVSVWERADLVESQIPLTPPVGHHHPFHFLFSKCDDDYDLGDDDDHGDHHHHHHHHL